MTSSKSVALQIQNVISYHNSHNSGKYNKSCQTRSNIFNYFFFQRSNLTTKLELTSNYYREAIICYKNSCFHLKVKSHTHFFWFCTATLGDRLWKILAPNRPFPSSLVPLFQNKRKCETFHMKMSSACSFIFMQMKVIFIRMISHLDSVWNRGTRELGNGPFSANQEPK